MGDFASYVFCKLRAKYYLMKANRIMKYYESLPYRRLALNYEMRAHAIKQRRHRKW